MAEKKPRATKYIGKKPRPTETIDVMAKINVGDLVHAVYTNMHPDEVIGFIKDLDDRMCDLAFTVRLRDHFRDLVKRERESTGTKIKPAPELATRFAHIPAGSSDDVTCGIPYAGARIASLLQRQGRLSWDGGGRKLCPECLEKLTPLPASLSHALWPNVATTACGLPLEGLKLASVDRKNQLHARPGFPMCRECYDKCLDAQG